MLSIGTSNGANKPFLALVVLDLWDLLGEYGIEVATFNCNHQVEECREKRLFDRWRFVSLDKVT